MKKHFIGGYVDPINITDENYRVLKESGINTLFIVHCGLHNRTQQDILKILTLCDKYKIDAYISATFPEKFNFEEFKKFKSFAGMLCVDEPKADEYDNVAKVLDDFNDNFKNQCFYVNLFPDPTCNFQNALHCNSWEEYVDLFCEKVLSKINGERMLSTDVYPLLTESEQYKHTDFFIEERYLRVLEYISFKAKEYNAIPTIYLQTMGYKGYINRRRPNEKELRFNAYCSLCYGFKNLIHFTYSTPSENYEFRKSDYAMTDREDNKTEIYEYAKNVNKTINSVLDILEKTTYNGVIPIYGKNEMDKQNVFHQLKLPLSKLKDIKVIESQYDAIIGEFLGLQNIYMAVNFTDPSYCLSNTITFETNKNIKILNKDKKQIIKQKDNKVQLKIDSGEAILFKIV